MEKDGVSETTKRLRELVGDKVAQFAELIGEKPQRLKDVLGGRQRLPEDMLVRLVQSTNVDLNWLLAGIGAGSGMSLTPREALLLQRYRLATEDGRKAIDAMAAALGVVSPAEQAPSKQVFKGRVNTVQSVHQGSMTNNYAAAAAKTRSRKGG